MQPIQPDRPVQADDKRYRTTGNYYLSDEDIIMVEVIDPFGEVDVIPFDALEWLDDLLDDLF